MKATGKASRPRPLRVGLGMLLGLGAAALWAGGNPGNPVGGAAEAGPAEGAPVEERNLAVGDRAPAFPNPLPSTAGDGPGARSLALDEVLGKKNIVLAFYVADWTGGWTLQFSSYKDDIQEFLDADTQVFGISVDTPYSQWNWLQSVGQESGMMVEPAQAGELPGLVLLSDRQAEVIGAYGVTPLEINGATYASRATFVIDREGVLRYVNYDYQIREDYEPLMEALAGLE